jgi:hypothetical protein
MAVSIVDDGGEVMAIVHGSRRFSPPPVRSNLAPLVQKKRRPRRRWK